MEFKYKKKKKALRFKNWKNFIKKDKETFHKRKFLIALVTYNNAEETVNLIKNFNQSEEDNPFDILVVDNCSMPSQRKILKKGTSKYKNVILLETKDNLGGGGGNAIAFEYFLNKKKYQYCLLTEDDAIPCSKNLIANIFKVANPKKIIKAHHKIRNSHSGAFHFTLYPKNIIKSIGVPDARFFMRADDNEFNKRVQKEIKKQNYEIIHLNKLDYSHPLIEKNVSSLWRKYFMIRNQLIVYSRHNFNIKFLIKIFFYIWHGVLYWLIENDFSILKMVFIAGLDFSLLRYNNEINHKRLRFFKNQKVEFPNTKREKWTAKGKVFKRIRNKFTTSRNLFDTFNNIFIKKDLNIKFSFFPHKEIIISHYFSSAFPINALAKKMHVVEEIKDDKIFYWQYYPSTNFKLIKYFFSIIVTFLLFIFSLPFIIISGLIERYFK